MSDSSQGPGWWQDTDGKWYPPRPDAPGAPDPDATQPMEPTLPADGPPEGPPEELLITPMSDPDVPPGEPTTIMPAVPPPPPEPTVPIVPTDPAYPPEEIVPPPPPPWYREYWWVVALVALLLAALIIWIIWATGDDDDSLETSESTIATSSLPSSTAPSTSAPATTAPETTVPETTAPATTEPATTAPATEPATTTTTEAPATTTTEATTTTAATTTTTTAATTTTTPPTTVPPPFETQGSGNGTPGITIPGGGVGVATITHTGPGEFVVQAGQVTLIQNAEGGYDGTVVVPQGTTSLGITADGDWTIRVDAPGAARTFSGNATGNRPDVLLYTGPGGTVTVTPDDLVLKVFDEDGNQSDVVNGGELPEGSLVQFDQAPWSISVS